MGPNVVLRQLFDSVEGSFTRFAIVRPLFLVVLADPKKSWPEKEQIR